MKSIVKEKLARSLLEYAEKLPEGNSFSVDDKRADQISYFRTVKDTHKTEMFRKDSREKSDVSWITHLLIDQSMNDKGETNITYLHFQEEKDSETVVSHPYFEGNVEDIGVMALWGAVRHAKNTVAQISKSEPVNA